MQRIPCHGQGGVLDVNKKKYVYYFFLDLIFNKKNIFVFVAAHEKKIKNY